MNLTPEQQDLLIRAAAVLKKRRYMRMQFFTAMTFHLSWIILGLSFPRGSFPALIPALAVTGALAGMWCITYLTLNLGDIIKADKIVKIIKKAEEEDEE